jgi:hypothetical protein
MVIISVSHRVQTGSAVHSASYSIVPGALNPGVKRPERQADHSALSSAEVKNVWCYTIIFTYPIRLHGVYLIK